MKRKTSIRQGRQIIERLGQLHKSGPTNMPTISDRPGGTEAEQSLSQHSIQMPAFPHTRGLMPNSHMGCTMSSVLS